MAPPISSSSSTTSSVRGDCASPWLSCSRAVLLGSGSSSSTPSIRCLLRPSPCAVCLDAYRNPQSKNRRHNPSLLLQFEKPEPTSSPDDGAEGNKAHENEGHPSPRRSFFNLLIDCGKTFREVALQHFSNLGVQYIEAVLLTHGHSDAILGVDDLREFNAPGDEGVTHQARQCAIANGEGTAAAAAAAAEEQLLTSGIQVYADEATMKVCRDMFGYLFPKPLAPGEARRWTAALNWRVMPPVEVLTIPMRCRWTSTRSTHESSEEEKKAGPHGGSPGSGIAYIPVVPVPVLHGANYYSNGFVFALGSLPSIEEAMALRECIEKEGAAAPVGSPGEEEGSTFSLPAVVLKAVEASHFFYYISDVSCLTELAYNQLEDAKWKLLFSAFTTRAATAMGFSSGTIPPRPRSILLPTALLVIDMLNHFDSRSTHFDVPRTIEATKRIDAQKTFYVGMSHDLSAEEITEIVKREGLEGKAYGGYDGAVIFKKP